MPPASGDDQPALIAGVEETPTRTASIAAAAQMPVRAVHDRIRTLHNQAAAPHTAAAAAACPDGKPYPSFFPGHAPTGRPPSHPWIGNRGSADAGAGAAAQFAAPRGDDRRPPRHGRAAPAKRGLAAELGVSRTVIKSACAHLLAGGWIEGRHESGTYAGKAPSQTMPQFTRTSTGPRVTSRVSAGQPSSGRCRITLGHSRSCSASPPRLRRANRRPVVPSGSDSCRWHERRRRRRP